MNAGAGSHKFPFLAARAGRPVVYVVTAGRTLFGVHRLDANDLPTTHVLGFGHKAHATALAVGLQTFRDRHGAFPCSDELDAICTELIDDLDACMLDGNVPSTNLVKVEAVSPERMLARFMGTAIVFSVLRQGEDGVHVWDDITAPSTPSLVASKLECAWQLGYEVHLLPKPMRPGDDGGLARTLASAFAEWKWVLIAHMLRMML